MRLRFSQWSIKSLILQEISQHCVMMFLNSFSSCLISRACLIVGPNLEPESKHKCDLAQFSTMLSNPYITNKLFQTPVIRYMCTKSQASPYCMNSNNAFIQCSRSLLLVLFLTVITEKLQGIYQFITAHAWRHGGRCKS